MIFSRTFAMPNALTFSIAPIAAFLDRYCNGGVIVDPFARDSKRGTITNDINPLTSAQYHLHAVEFLAKLTADGVVASAVLFDPPYSPRQISEAYKVAGIKATTQDTQNARLYGDVKRAATALLHPGGYALSFGWNSMGFGLKNGFEMGAVGCPRRRT